MPLIGRCSGLGVSRQDPAEAVLPTVRPHPSMGLRPWTREPGSRGGIRTPIREKTRGRIRSYLQSNDDWNLSRSLKNLIEQAVRDYEHRALVELLQNARVRGGLRREESACTRRMG